MNLFRLRCRLSAFLQDTNLECSRLLHYLSLQIVSYRLFSVLFFFSKSNFHTCFYASCSMTYNMSRIVHRYCFVYTSLKTNEKFLYWKTIFPLIFRNTISTGMNNSLLFLNEGFEVTYLYGP